MTEKPFEPVVAFRRMRAITRYHILSVATSMLVTLLSVSNGRSSLAFNSLPNMQQFNTVGTKHTEDKVFNVEPGQPIELRLSSGEAHLFPITLTEGQFLSLVVEQRGVDLSLTLIGADDIPVFQIDSTSASRGEESLFFISESTGTYKVRVQPARTGSGGDYTLLIKAIRKALPDDLPLVAATKAMAEGNRLRKFRKGEAIRKAIDNYSQALALWRQTGNAKEEGKALYNTGFAYALLDDYSRSLEFYLPALPLILEHGTQEEQAATLLNIGIGTLSIGENSEAITYFEQARELFDGLKIQGGLAFALGEIGRAHYLLGENQEALGFYDRALNIWHEMGIGQREAFMLDLIGRAHLSLGEWEEALKSFNAALATLEHAPNPRNQADTLTDLGRLYMAEGNSSEARNCFRKALPLFDQDSGQIGRAETLAYLGEAEANLGQTTEALEHFDEALKIQEEIKDTRGQGDTLYKIGAAYFVAGKPSRALEHLEKALKLWQENGYRPGEANTRYEISRVQRSLGHLGEARAEIEAAVSIIESQRSTLVGANPRASYFASVRNYYEQYIAVLMDLHDQNPHAGFDRLALNASERARARLLLDAFEQAQQGFRGVDDQALLVRRKQLRQQLSSSADLQIRLLSNNLLPQQASRLKGRLAEVEEQLQAVEEQLMLSKPKIAGLTSPKILTAVEIQQQVFDDDTMLLEYALGDEHSYLWVVGKAGVSTFKLPGRVEVASAVLPFNELVRKRNWEAGDEVRFEALSRALGRTLLEQAASLLGEKRLVIIPDGLLQLVPFAALQIPSTAPRQGRDTGGAGDGAVFEPLLVRHEIIYEPSASTVAAIRHESDRRVAPRLAAAIIADPVFGSGNVRPAARGGEQAQGSNMRGSAGETAERAAAELNLAARGAPIPPLLTSGEEAREIYKIARPEGALLALRFKANRATATSPELARYRVVHFSTHALLNTERPDLSGIVLSLVDERGNPQDGFLQLYEIYNLNLPVELVVLSACQTALGREVKGEGLISLMRGFMSAGARRVAATLWEVDDEATTELMRQFYLNMLDGRRPPAAAALRSAQLSLLGRKDRWAQPFYWAGFIVQGEWGPLPATRRTTGGRSDGVK
jgi:CHAT domain-containing protein/tetratricopeptide (TPR) repeat protein